MTTETDPDPDEPEGRGTGTGEHSDPKIPEQIREVMKDEEIENMQNLDGWAVGTVQRLDNEIVAEQISDAWIELFNGEGRAGEFGGVRLMAVDEDGEYRESYAYGSAESMERSGSSSGWYVKFFSKPENPEVGEEAP